MVPGKTLSTEKNPRKHCHKRTECFSLQIVGAYPVETGSFLDIKAEVIRRPEVTHSFGEQINLFNLHEILGIKCDWRGRTLKGKRDSSVCRGGLSARRSQHRCSVLIRRESSGTREPIDSGGGN